MHPELNRAITPREAARIQSFPDKFTFFGKKTSVCRQIGNAVPPLLAKEIGNSIQNAFQNLYSEIIGRSKVYFGDCLRISLTDLPQVDAIITDPPYNISKENNLSTLRGQRKGLDFGN